MKWGGGREAAAALGATGFAELPTVFLHHDRQNHAERQGLLAVWAAGAVEADLFASHTPCVACLMSLAQTRARAPALRLSVGFQRWESREQPVGPGFHPPSPNSSELA